MQRYKAIMVPKFPGMPRRMNNMQQIVAKWSKGAGYPRNNSVLSDPFPCWYSSNINRVSFKIGIVAFIIKSLLVVVLIVDVWDNNVSILDCRILPIIMADSFVFQVIAPWICYIVSLQKKEKRKWDWVNEESASFDCF